MKKIVLLGISFIAATVMMAQVPAVVKAYLVMNSTDRFEISMHKDNGKWVGKNQETGQPCATYVSANNTYMKVTDNGTGGGVITIQLKVVKLAKNKSIILVSTLISDGLRNEATLKCFECDEFATAEISNIYPKDLPISFMKNTCPNNLKKYFEEGNFTYSLNEKDTNVKCAPNFVNINTACINDDPLGCGAKQYILPPTIWKWDTIKLKLKK